MQYFFEKIDSGPYAVVAVVVFVFFWLGVDLFIERLIRRKAEKAKKRV